MLLCSTMAGATDCFVAGFEAVDIEQQEFAWIEQPERQRVLTGVSIERCARVTVACRDYGSRIIEPGKLWAYFVDGRNAQGRGHTASFRLSGGERRTLYTCFGLSPVPIQRIEGRF